MGRGEGAATLSTFTRIDENTGNEGAQGKRSVGGRKSRSIGIGQRGRGAGYLTFFTLGREAGGGEIVLPLPLPLLLFHPPKTECGRRYVDTFVYRYTGGYIFVTR